MKPDIKSKDTSFDLSLFKSIMYYVVSIILGPIITFFVTKVTFNGIFKTSDVTSNVSSAVAAIVMLHVIVGMYIYKAYSEAGKGKPEKID